MERQKKDGSLSSALIMIQEYSMNQDEYIDHIESQLDSLKKITGEFPNGMGDYEWKLIENYNSKNFRIKDLQSQLKKEQEENKGLKVQMRALQGVVNELMKENKGLNIQLTALKNLVGNAIKNDGSGTMNLKS